MTAKWRWVDRTFTFDFPVGKFPEILSRYRGTPARLEELVRHHPPSHLAWHDAPSTWSILQNIGHLLDLEALWERRLDDYLAGKEMLSAADMTNAATNLGDFDSREPDDLLRSFRTARGRVVDRLERLPESDWARVSIHPRLKQHMRLVDAIAFTSDHDDYHLARISELIAGAKLAR